ncbi:hypothetical protein ABPG72_014684 [Tetrahymena utriculariae]
MSGAIRQVSNFFSKKSPTIWHFRISSSLSSQVLEDNLQYLRAMRHKEGQVFALSISSFQKSRDTARVITFYDALRQASEKLRAPLYTFSEDQALGDSYLLLSLGETVSANPFSIIGSINSRINYISFEKLFERLGIKYDIYTSSSPAFLPSRKPTPSDIQLAEQSNQEVLESIQNLILQKRGKHFENKGISREQAKNEILSGQTFTAQQALKNGLIDQIGTFYEFKDSMYPLHKIRTPERFPQKTQIFPKINKDILILAEMSQEIEMILSSAPSTATDQQIVQTAEVRLAEFFTRKLKEPEFLIAFENYLLNEFEQQKSMIERKQELIEILS